MTGVSVSEEMGPELGKPHYFWMDRRYTMSLECGHQQAHIRSNFNYLPPEELMPERVRYKDYPPRQIVSKAKPCSGGCSMSTYRRYPTAREVTYDRMSNGYEAATCPRLCKECLNPVDTEGITPGDCPGGSGEKCGQCFYCFCDGSC